MEQTHDYAFILGSHPILSLAELDAVVGLQLAVTDHKTVALLHQPQPLDPAALMQRLGGTVKIAALSQLHRNIDSIDFSELAKLIPTNGGRAVFGVSVYQAESMYAENKMRTLGKEIGLALKQFFKTGGRGARMVTNKDGSPLSAVTIQKEHLLTKGREIVLVLQRHHLHAGVTSAVQPYEEFSLRDYGRPGREMKTGMLPPKIARIMVNLASPKIDSRILDPFVGNGTILMEALLMGFKRVEGNDIDQAALERTRKNLAWLKLPQVKLHHYRAERLTHHIKSGVYDRIIFEGDLGPTDQRKISRNLATIKVDLGQLYREALTAFFHLLKPGGILVGAFPAWRVGRPHYFSPATHQDHEPDDFMKPNNIQSTHEERFQTLEISDWARAAGFEVTNQEFVYGRPDSMVLRQIWIMNKPDR